MFNLGPHKIKPLINGDFEHPQLFATKLDQHALQLLCRYPVAREISLMGLKIECDCVYGLVEYLTTLETLETLALYGNYYFHDKTRDPRHAFITVFLECCQHLVSKKAHKKPPLKNLTIGHSALSSDQLLQLMRLFPFIQTLDLSGNFALEISKKIAGKIAQLKTLKSLTLKNCFLDKTSIENLVKALAAPSSNTQLKELTLSGQYVFDEEKVIPFEELLDNKIGLKKLALFFIPLSIRDLEALARALESNQTLQTLTIDLSRLTGDSFAKQGLNELVYVLKLNKTLQKLEIYDDSDTSLELTITHEFSLGDIFQQEAWIKTMCQRYSLDRFYKNSELCEHEILAKRKRKKEEHEQPTNGVKRKP